MSADGAPERRYVLTRVEAGDYLLPSNDGAALWRLVRYVDGPSRGLADWPRDRQVWGVYRLARPFNGTLRPDEVDDLTAWELIESMLETRREAIDVALRWPA